MCWAERTDASSPLGYWCGMWSDQTALLTSRLTSSLVPVEIEIADVVIGGVPVNVSYGSN